MSSLFVYFSPNEPISANDIDSMKVSVNGVPATINAHALLPTKDGQLFCANIIPSQQIKFGDRLFVAIEGFGQCTYGSCAKAFYPFALGSTQYGKVMRPVDIEHSKDSIVLNVYNEADFRKCPAIIERVYLDGNDITNQCVFPDEPFPPDLHNYDSDVRPIIIKNIRLEPKRKHRLDIDFKRLAPLRPSPVAGGYFDTQRFSFDVQAGIPYEIDQEGLVGGTCILYAGLRPRPETNELINRFNSVASVDPTIPVYMCPHEGTQPDVVFQLAACCDFIFWLFN